MIRHLRILNNSKFGSVRILAASNYKGRPTSFSPLTSLNIGISPQYFVTFSLNHLVLVNHIELEPRPPLKKSVFMVESL